MADRTSPKSEKSKELIHTEPQTKIEEIRMTDTNFRSILLLKTRRYCYDLGAQIIAISTSFQ